MSSIGNPLGNSHRGLFSPLDVSGLILWLKADSLSLNDGDAVSSWIDSSGSGNNASSSGSNRPLYKTNILNGLPVVRFDGSNDFMTVTRNVGLEPSAVTIFAVVRASAAPANSSYALSKKFTTGSAASYAIQRSSSTLAARFICRTTGANNTGGIINDSAVWDGNGHVIVGIANTGTQLLGSCFVNVVLGNSGLGAGGLTYDTNDFIIGSYDGTQLWMAFDLAELLIYNSVLTVGQVGKITNYLGDSSRWNISV